MSVVVGITVVVHIVVAVVMTIIEARVITKIIIIDLIVVTRTIEKGKMRRGTLPNKIFKKTLVIDVERLVFFETISYFQTSCGYVLGIPKPKGKNVKINYVDYSDSMNVTYFDVSDFFEDKDRKIDYLIGDENIHHI